MKKIILLVAMLIILAPFTVIIYGYRQATKPADNSPGNFFKSRIGNQAKTVVCVGDSITHGRVSCDYVKLLEQRYGEKGFTFVNAGINSELAWNVLKRIDEIISCDPDYITVLIGTNDAHGSYDETVAEKQIDMFDLPQKPDINWYRENLIEIILKLRQQTDAKIALLSIPPIGESEDYEGFLVAMEFSNVARDVAAITGVRYLSLNEKMRAYLEINRVEQTHGFEKSPSLMYRAIFDHVILRKSFDAISEKNGFIILTDFLHLNSRGGDMIAELIGTFITEG